MTIAKSSTIEAADFFELTTDADRHHVASHAASFRRSAAPR